MINYKKNLLRCEVLIRPVVVAYQRVSIQKFGKTFVLRRQKKIARFYDVFLEGM